MALQHSFSFRGLSTTTAYFRITEVVQSRSRNRNYVHVAVYASGAASADQEPLEYLVRDTDYDNNMSVASAYMYLKTLPEYAGAQDV